jgi:hypothetical protein
MLVQSFNEQVGLPEYNQDVPKDILVQFLASAGVGVIEWWFANSMPYSAEEITEQLWKLLERHHLLFTHTL